mgnify:CR=1 FL=1
MRLSIPDMHCGGCVKGVTRAAQTVDAGARVTPDLETREATLETRASEADILAALARAGFSATVK